MKKSFVLQLLGIGRQILLLDRLAFWRWAQPSSCLHFVINMQVWGVGLGPRSVDLHRLSRSCSLPYSKIFSLWLWQTPLSLPPYLASTPKAVSEIICLIRFFPFLFSLPLPHFSAASSTSFSSHLTPLILQSVGRCECWPAPFSSVAFQRSTLLSSIFSFFLREVTWISVKWCHCFSSYPTQVSLLPR